MALGFPSPGFTSWYSCDSPAPAHALPSPIPPQPHTGTTLPFCKNKWEKCKVSNLKVCTHLSSSSEPCNLPCVATRMMSAEHAIRTAATAAPVPRRPTIFPWPPCSASSAIKTVQRPFPRHLPVSLHDRIPRKTQSLQDWGGSASSPTKGHPLVIWSRNLSLRLHMIRARSREAFYNGASTVEHGLTVLRFQANRRRQRIGEGG